MMYFYRLSFILWIGYFFLSEIGLDGCSLTVFTNKKPRKVCLITRNKFCSIACRTTQPTVLKGQIKFVRIWESFIFSNLETKSTKSSFFINHQIIQVQWTFVRVPNLKTTPWNVFQRKQVSKSNSSRARIKNSSFCKLQKAKIASKSNLVLHEPILSKQRTQLGLPNQVICSIVLD